MSETQTKSPGEARSKILRLSFADRMAFNRMVRDKYAGPKLIVWLADHGVPGVSAENLRLYRHSPAYKAWLEEEQSVDRDREAVEQAMRLASAVGGSASDRLKSILAGKMYRLLQGVTSPEDSKSIVECFRAITESERLDIQRQQVAQRDQLIAIQREKHEVDTCEKFLAWYSDEKAKQIAESAASNSDKIVALRQTYFKDIDELAAQGEVILPK
jgi:hypothetical protein